MASVFSGECPRSVGTSGICRRPQRVGNESWLRKGEIRRWETWGKRRACRVASLALRHIKRRGWCLFVTLGMRDHDLSRCHSLIFKPLTYGGMPSLHPSGGASATPQHVTKPSLSPTDSLTSQRRRSVLIYVASGFEAESIQRWEDLIDGGHGWGLR